MTVCKPSSPHRAESLPEVCLNLWYVRDEGGLVYRLAGRAYALTGTEQEKLRVLHALSATDFYVATMFVVPERYKAVLGNSTIPGVVEPGFIRQYQTDVFKEVIDSLETALPPQMRSVDGDPRTFKLSIPQDPLIVLTCILEDENGHLTPWIADKTE